jgi:SAM-dependent methyltransferase
MPRYEQTDWYDLPLYYDIVYGQGTLHEADFLRTIFDRYVGRSTGRILEPACGTGRLMTTLSQAGFEVSGFDISEPMLAFARSRLQAAGRAAQTKQASLDDFNFRQRFDLAHCLVSSFKYLLSEAAARAHLERVVESLRTGGIYVLGLHLTDYQDQRRQRERWVGQRNGVKVINNLQSWPPDARSRRERLRSRLIVQTPDRTRRYETHWLFRTYNSRQLKRLLAGVPRLQHLATYDFHYDAEDAASLASPGLDKVLILQKGAR